MIDFYGVYDIKKYGWIGAAMHDPTVIAYLIDPTLFTGKRLSFAIDHSDEASLGNTYARTDGSEPNATVMFDIDAERFFKLVVSRWSRL
jgi:purine nucleosidase